jgi:hypothetical protein
VRWQKSNSFANLGLQGWFAAVYKCVVLLTDNLSAEVFVNSLRLVVDRVSSYLCAGGEKTK